MKQSYKSGLDGENIAAEFILGRGMRIVHRRFRAGDGEIDLIAQDGRQLVFIEVKYRPRARLGEAKEALTNEKMRRIKSSASQYLLKNPSSYYRFDLIEITRAGVWHVKNCI